MEQTTNYGLNKPGRSDYAKIDVLNANMDAIDAALKGLDESKAEGAALAAHEADGVKHVTAAERTAWNAKAAGDHTHTAAQVGAVPTTRKVNGKALSAALEEIKPAHLTYGYIVLYRTWGELEEKTWGELESRTWDEILGGEL